MYLSTLKKIIDALKNNEAVDSYLQDIATPWGKILKDTSLDAAFKAHILEIPNEATLFQEFDNSDVLLNAKALKTLNAFLAKTFESDLVKIYQEMGKAARGALSSKTMGARA